MKIKKKTNIYELVLIVVAEVVSQNSDHAQRPRSILDKAFKMGCRENKQRLNKQRV